MPADHSAIYLGLLLYAVYVLLPIVPAAFIYWRFPKSTSEVSGPLQGLSIKAGGAFGAYVVTVAAGYFIVDNIQESIAAERGVAEWTVQADLEKPDGTALSPLSAVNAVVFDPVEKQYTVGGQLYLTVHRDVQRPWPIVYVSAEGFQPATIDLRQAAERKELLPNGRLTLKLKPKVRLSALPKGLDQPASYTATEALAPLPEGAPPK